MVVAVNVVVVSAVVVVLFVFVGVVVAMVVVVVIIVYCIRIVVVVSLEECRLGTRNTVLTCVLSFAFHRARFIVLVSLTERIVLSVLFFFFLCVAERSYRQVGEKHIELANARLG